MPATSHQGRAYTREEIERTLRGALVTLMADGSTFRSLSVERLRTEAGISRSSFYVYFADKADLLAALEAGSLKRLYDTQRRWIRLGGHATRDDIRSCMRELLDRFLEDEVVMRAIGEASAYEPTIREAYSSGVRGYARAMERLVAEQRPDLPAQRTAEALAWMTERTVFMSAPGSSAATLDALAESLTAVVWATLFA